MQITAQEYKAGNQESGPYGIAAGRDGAIWFTEQKETGSGESPRRDMRTFDVPTPDAGVMSILSALTVTSGSRSTKRIKSDG